MTSSPDIWIEKSGQEISGKRSRTRCDGKLLSAEKEKKIAKVVEGMREIGHKPTIDCIRGLVHSEINQNENSDIYVSKTWYNTLRTHYPSIERDSNILCDYRRVLNRTNCVKAADIFFNVLQSDLISSIPPERRYSMSALGWFLAKRTYENDRGSLIASDRFEINRLVQEERVNKFESWVTCIECVSATGKSLPSCAIFPSENARKKYMQNQREASQELRTLSLETEMRYSEFEYGEDRNIMDDDIFRKWARDVFFTETQPTSILEPRLLLLDGKKSHEKKLIIDCLKNNVIIVYLPQWDKRSNFNQDYLNTPINVSFFNPLKRQYLDLLESIDTNTSKIYTSPEMSDVNSFLVWYQKIKKTFTGNENYGDIIIFAFKLTGIWPLNLDYSTKSKKLIKGDNLRGNEYEVCSIDNCVATINGVPSSLWDIDWGKKDLNQSLRAIDKISSLIRGYTNDNQKKADISQLCRNFELLEVFEQLIKSNFWSLKVDHISFLVF